MPENPSWQFSTVDRNGPFAWPEGQNEEKEILGTLRQIDGMAWSEVEGGNHHSISIADLSKEAQQRLRDISQDDVDELFSFRITGKKRVFSIRHNNIAKLLWWDPRHQVCPSKKKHT